MARDDEQKPKVDASVPVTPENMLDHPGTPGDMLHQHVRNTVAKPAADRTSEEEEGLKSAVKHPNIPGQALADVFAHFTSPDAADDQDILQDALANPKLPAELATKYLQDTSNDMNWNTKSRHTAAASHPGVDPKMLEQLANEQIENPENEETHEYEHLSPEFYHSLLSNRPIPEPENGRMTDSQKATNRKVKKIDDLVTNSIGRTPHHTPETLDQAINAFSSQLPEGMKAERANKVLHDLVHHQKNLTSHQIDKIASTKFEGDSYGVNDHRAAALSHANADPKLLARYANSTDPDESDMSEVALANPNLPEETKKAIIGSDMATRHDKLRMSGLLQNPSLSPEDVREIYKKDPSAVSHENAPPDILENYAETKKTADGARTLLKKKQLPPSVLSKIVTTNKNPGVVEEALDHPSADISVVQAAMKRKAPWAQQAAMRHPLVAKQYLMDGLTSGKITPSDFIFDKKNSQALDNKVPPEAINHIDKMYANGLPEGDEDAQSVKNWLATDDQVPPEVRARNAKELSEHFLSTDHPIGNINNQIIQLAQEHGNADAQDALLQRPDVLENANLSHQQYPASFLEQAAQKMQGPTQSASRAEIARNPNVSLDTFRNLTHDPKFLSDPDNLSASQHSWREDSQGHSSVFDKRWAELPPEERDAEFKQLSDLNTPDANKAILKSNSAPKDLWNAKFSEASPADLHDWFNNNNLSDFADNTTLDNVLNLRTTSEDERYPGTPEATPVMEALKALDPANPQHREMLSNFVLNIGNLDEIRRLNRRDVANSIPDNMIKGARGSELIDTALKSDPTLGAEMAGKRAALTLEDSGYDAQAVDQAKSTAVRDMDEQFKQSSGGDPEAYKNMWDAMLSSDQGMDLSQQGLRAIGHDSKNKPNGKLDFLANIPGDEDHVIRDRAMQLNLISPEMSAQLSDENPEAFSKTIHSLDAPVQHDKMSAFVNRQMTKPEVSDDAIDAIVNSTENQVLTGHEVVGRRGQKAKPAGPEKIARAHELLGNITDLALRHSDAPGNAISKLATRTASTSGGVNDAGKKALIKTIIDKVKASAIPEEDKDSILLDMSNAISRDGNQDVIPAKFQAELVKKSVASGNISAITRVLKSGDAPKSAWNAVGTALKTPENLSNDDLTSLAELSSYPNVSASAASRLMDTMTDRIIADPAGEDSDSMIRSVSKMIDMNVQSDDQVKAESAFASGMKLSNSTQDLEHQERIAASMVQGFTNENIALEHKVAAFRNLPDHLDSYVVPNHTVLSEDMVNMPGMLETAQDGWKLTLMSQAARNMNPDTAKVIANRLVNSQSQGTERSKYHFLRGSVSSNLSPENAVDPMDVVKVARTMDPDALSRMVNDLNDYNSAQPKHYMVMPVILDNLEANMLNPSANINAWHENMGTAANSANLLAKALDQDQSPQGVKVKHNFLLGRALDLTSQLMDHIATNSGDTISPETTQMLSSNFVHAFNSVDGQRWSETSHTEATTKKYLDLLSKGKQLAEKTKNSDVPFSMSRVNLGAWSKKATLSAAGWKDALGQHPEIAFDLQMSSVSSDVLDALDYGALLKTRFSDTQDMFQSWMGKIEPDARTKHVRGMLEAMGKAIGDEYVSDDASEEHADNVSEKRKQQAFMNVAEKAVTHVPTAFDTNYLKKVMNTVDDPQHQKDIRTKALYSGAGGQHFADYSWTQSKKSDMHPEDAIPFADSPSITDTIANGLVDLLGKSDSGSTPELLKSMLDNTTISEEPFKRIIGASMEMLKSGEVDKYGRKQIVKRLMKHPKVDQATYFKLYDETKDEYPEGFTPGEPFNPAFTNSRFGGDLFRAQPVTVPDQFHSQVNPDNLVTKAEHSVAKDRLNEALAVIPPQGITWADFKKQQPKMQNWPEVKQMFMSKNNKPVMPEDVAASMSQHDGYDFHVTYTKWSGAQRHTSANNLVMQLNTSASMEKKISEDPKRWALFQFVQKSANHTAGDNVGGHPVTPHCASWVRIDTSGGKKGWIIEEFQSDFGARMHSEIDALAKQAEQKDFKIDDFSFTADEMHQYTNDIAEIIGGWHKASLNAVEELAKRNGVSDMYLHGSGIRATLSGMSKTKELPVWLQKMYDKTPKAENWTPIDYSDYPNKGKTDKDAKKEGYSTQCWKKPLKS